MSDEPKTAMSRNRQRQKQYGGLSTTAAKGAAFGRDDTQCGGAFKKNKYGNAI
jgi:hypothetical protein